MNAYVRFTLLEYWYSVKRVVAVYWWVLGVVASLALAGFAEKPDLTAKLAILAIMFVMLKAVFWMMALNELRKEKREEQQYEAEPANSIGRPDNILDFPAFQRRQHDAAWAEKVLAGINNRKPDNDEVLVDQHKLDTIPAFKRRRKPELPN